MLINIPPLTKYIRELTEYQILIFGIQPNIELFGEYIWSNRILNYSVVTLNKTQLNTGTSKQRSALQRIGNNKFWEELMRQYC